MSKNSIIVPGLENLPKPTERQEKQIPPMGPIRSKKTIMFRCAFTNKPSFAFACQKEVPHLNILYF